MKIDGPLWAGTPSPGPNEQAEQPPISDIDSPDWSGFADTGPANSFTTVSDSWFVRRPTCTSPGISMVAFFVGLDGEGDGTAEEAGALTECDARTIYDYAWWEMAPTNSIQIVIAIASDDTYTANVSFSDGSYTLSVTDDSTSAYSFTTTQTCGATPCDNSSAEWIAEATPRPSGDGLYDLAEFDFGQWTPDNTDTT